MNGFWRRSQAVGTDIMEKVGVKSPVRFADSRDVSWGH